MLRRGYEFTAGYRLQEYLGKGQFGEVWRASGPGGTKWAVKFVGMEDGRGKKEFEAIKQIKSIRHANLMPITAIWQLDRDGQLIDDTPEVEQTVDLISQESRGQSGFVLTPRPEPAQLIVGMTLGDASLEKFLPQDKSSPHERLQIPTGELLKYMEGTARGLDFLNSPVHNLGSGTVSLQHCDVKPANIVIVGDSAVLCDFGLARILSGNQIEVTNPAGTPAYMSPESIDSNPSKTSDQYSLAVTYYHLRTGTLPLDDKTIHTVLRAHMSGALTFDRVPEIERQVLRRATHLDWRKRFESNSHFVSALRDVLRQQGIDTSGQMGVLATPAVSNPGAPQRIPGPSGPAVLGVEDVDAEDLTGGFVRHSKGGSPILSGPGSGSAAPSHDTWAPGSAIAEDSASGSQDDLQPAVETADLRLVKRIAAGRAGSSGSHAIAPDAFQFDAIETEPSSMGLPRQRLIWIASMAAAFVLLSSTVWWFPRSETIAEVEPPPVVGTSLVDDLITLDAAKAEIDRDWSKASQLFGTLIERDPKSEEVVVSLSPSHVDAIQVLLPLGQSNRFITTGFDTTPRIWMLDASEDPAALPPWQPVELYQLDRPVLFPNAVTQSRSQSLLSIGASGHFACWQTQSLANAKPDEFPMAPDATHQFDASIIAVASPPQASGLIAVALEDAHLVVLDADPSKHTAKVIASTQTSDFVKSMSFIGDGSTLLIQFEDGELVAMRWDELLASQSDQRATPTIDLGVNDCQVIVLSPGTRSDSFWVGHDSGIVTQHRINDFASMSVSVSRTIDSVAQGPITVLDLLPDSQYSRAHLISGSEDSSIAICELDSRVPATILPLPTGRVRCIVHDERGQWFAAGVEKGVWVGRVDQPSDYKTFIPIGNVSAEGLCLDSTTKTLLVGCSDGKLAWFDWDHARLKASLPTSSGSLPQAEDREPRPSTKPPTVSEI